MPINICSNLFDVSIPNVFVMYSSILNYLYNTFELNESKNINNYAEPNVMKENPSLYLFDIVLTTYHFFHELKKYRYTNKYHHDTHRNS